MPSTNSPKDASSPKSSALRLSWRHIRSCPCNWAAAKEYSNNSLYEAASRFGEIGTGVSFGPDAVTSIAMIDPAIKAGFDKCAKFNQSEAKARSWFDFRVRDDRWVQKNPSSAKELSLLNWVYQVDNAIGQCSVHRAHFLDVMVKLIEGDAAKFGKRLVNVGHLVNGDVRLEFQGGTKAVHDAIIGWDGIKSKTREVLLRPEHHATRAVFSGIYV